MLGKGVLLLKIVTKRQNVKTLKRLKRLKRLGVCRLNDRFDSLDRGEVGDSQGWGLRRAETDGHGESHFTSSANLPVLDFKLGNGQIDKG